MFRRPYSRIASVLVMAFLVSGLIQPAWAGLAGQGSRPQIEPELANQLQAKGEAGYLIYFREIADLSSAQGMGWEARGETVMRTLQETAEKSQARTRRYLDGQGVEYQAFWIDNVILVERSGLAVFNQLQNYGEIEALRTRRVLGVIEPVVEPADVTSILAVEPNIAHVEAPGAWALGIDGGGMIVANIDTGVLYTHKALVDQYRGNLGGTVEHNYNWYDPYPTYTNIPTDGNGHGTHTMGTMLGDDGGVNKIGMAPGAEWIACRGCSGTNCADAQLLACGQFMAAPTNLTGGYPDPDLRPHVVNNSWGDCGASYDGWYQGVVDAWQAAGIYPVFSNGNATGCEYIEPPGLNTVGNPARYGNVTGVGSSGEADGLYATHSNWGPTDNLDTVNPRGYADLKPQVIAPGVSIRSAWSTSDNAYAEGKGTSMSAPHVAGLVALVWQAGPCLVGDYAATETLIEQTANPVPYDDTTGGGAHVPNYAAGWGEIDALAAVQAAISSCGDSTLTGTVTDSSTGLPAAGVKIVADNGADVYEDFTNEAGVYVLYPEAGTYTVTASALGYRTSTVNGVTTTTGGRTVLNIALDPLEAHLISGTVTDRDAEWPLYASITIPEMPGAAVWTDPVTGYYEVSLYEEAVYHFTIQAWTGGYENLTAVVGPLTGATSQDFSLVPDPDSCTAPGYPSAGGGATCEPEPGGLVVGVVSDKNDGQPVTGALVENDSGGSTTAAFTPDPEVGDAFYVLFSPDGPHDFTASNDLYTSQTASVNVVISDTVGHDFSLSAGRLTVSPVSFSVTLQPGEVTTRTLTLTNDGTDALSYTIVELPGIDSPGALAVKPAAEILSPASAGVSEGVDVPWLSEDVTAGDLAVLESQSIELTFDASAVSSPGTYRASLHILHDAPQAEIEIPIEVILPGHPHIFLPIVVRQHDG